MQRDFYGWKNGRLGNETSWRPILKQVSTDTGACITYELSQSGILIVGNHIECWAAGRLDNRVTGTAGQALQFSLPFPPISDVRATTAPFVSVLPVIGHYVIFRSGDAFHNGNIRGNGPAVFGNSRLPSGILVQGGAPTDHWGANPNVALNANNQFAFHCSYIIKNA